jgi:hypothetical protein
MSLKWNGDLALLEVRRVLGIGVGRAAERVAARVRAKIGTPYPPASQPGRPPHRRSGTLQQSVISVLDATDRARPVGYVQATAPHADHLERGTSRMAARPFLQPTLLEESGMVRKIISSFLS